MSARIRLSRFLLRLGRFIEASAVLVMRPDDLVEFSRQGYADPGRAESWGEEDVVGRGLNGLEQELLQTIPVKTGKVLLLNVGGGREAIPLAKLGYAVTGVDFIPHLVARAVENAARQGVELTGLVQELSRLEVPAQAYDLAWLGNHMYSCIPTRTRRIATLRRVRRALKPGGYFFLSFLRDEPPFAPGVERFRRMLARLAGNHSYETGDRLWHNVEFLHAFGSQSDFIAECEAGGFAVARLKLPETGGEGGAVLVAAGPEAPAGDGGPAISAGT
jgi:SAM-dependent methyltransferase